MSKALVATMFAVLLMVLPAGAQFSDLAAPGDGSELFYAGLGGIYRVGRTLPATLFISLPPPMLPSPPPPITSTGWYISPYSDAFNPQFSADGKTFSYTTRRTCLGGQGCWPVRLFQSTVIVPDKPPLTFDGKAWLSRNGRFLFYSTLNSTSDSNVIVDLETGTRSPVLLYGALEGGAGTSGMRIVADNGTIVAAGQVWTFGSANPVATVSTGRDSVIARAGRVVVGSSANESPRSVRAYDFATRKTTILTTADDDCHAPAVTADGKAAVFLCATPNDAPQLRMVSTDGSGGQTLTREATGVQTFGMTDDAGVIWYQTGDGRLVKIAPAGSIARPELRLPNVDLSLTLVPGSASILPASNAMDVEVSIDGIRAPILAASPTDITIQVPWEVQASKQVLVQAFKSGASSQSLIQSATTPVGFAPQLLNRVNDRWAYGTGGTAVHGDWSGFVTSLSPATAGEVVHFYGVGFGPVAGPMSTGKPASGESPLTMPLHCNADVLYAGLAPGLTGFYQLTIKLPDPAPYSYAAGIAQFNLMCQEAKRPLAAVPMIPCSQCN